ncbi:MAG: methyltransferase [Pseudomonadota bacterium]
MDFGGGALGDRIRRVYGRQLMNARTQSRLAEFPLTRAVSKGKARKLFDVCAGFVYSQVLKAIVELEVIELLVSEPMQSRDIAARLSLPRDRAERLLDAGVALNLFYLQSDGHYAVGELGAALIGCPGTLEMVRHHALLYDDLRDPVALLKSETPDTTVSKFWTYGSHDDARSLSDEDIETYSGLMAASIPPIADEVLGAYAFHSDDMLLDVGGGNGMLASIVARRAPHLKVATFDLPAVAPLAEARFRAQGQASRSQVFSGDFTQDEIPRGADVISLVRILLDHDDATVLKLLRRVRDALPRGGTVLIAEHMSGSRGAERTGDAYFGFYLLAMGRGRPRTPKQICNLLERAGFTAVRKVSSARPIFATVVLGRRKEEESAHEEQL